MLPLIMISPLIAGIISFFINPRALWIIPLIFVAILGAFGWESYLIHMSDSNVASYSYSFINLSSLQLNLDYKLDFLSIMGGGLVLFISFICCLYALEYPNSQKKSAIIGIISLLSFSMLQICFSNSIIPLIVGWMAMSFLVFFATNLKDNKSETSIISIKSLIINSISDLFFILAMIMLLTASGSSELETIFNNIGEKSPTYINFIAVFLVISILAKSGQFAFHVWLPEAMITPTAISAFLCSASIIVSGIFVAIKMFLLFEIAPNALLLLLWIGICTGLYGAILACVQSGIKKIAAYATISHTGIMLALIGLGYPMLSLFFLLCYAAYNTLLFINIGGIIKGVSSETDINKMGGLYKFMPIAYCFMWICVLTINYAIFAISPHFYTPDYNYFLQGVLIFIFGCITFFTAGYSFRLLLRVFHGTPKEEDSVMARINEKNPYIVIAMILLIASFFIINYGKNWLIFDDDAEINYNLLFIFIAIFGATSSFIAKKTSPLQKMKKIINDRRDFEELYSLLFVKPTKALSSLFKNIIEIKLIGGTEKLLTKSFEKVTNFYNNDKSTFEIGTFLIIIGIVGMVLYSMIMGGMIW